MEAGAFCLPEQGRKQCCGANGGDLSSNTWQEQNYLVLTFCDPLVGVFLEIMGMRTLS